MKFKHALHFTLLLSLILLTRGVVAAEYWPQGDNFQNPAVDASSSYVALSNGTDIEVWSLKKSVPEKKIWSFKDNNPNSVPLSYCWAGSELIVSIAQGNELPSRDDKEASKTASLVSFDVTNGQRYVLGEKAYWVLLCDSSGQHLAAATPVGGSLDDAQIDFYTLIDHDVELKGSFSKPNWGYIGEGTPYIIDWDKAGEGLYVVGGSETGDVSDSYRQLLLYIKPDGSSKSILPENASISPDERGSLPWSASINKGGVATHAEFARQADYYAYSGPNGIIERVGFSQLEKLAKGALSKFRVVCSTPDFRFILVQNLGQSGLLTPGQKADVWAFDIKNSRRMKIDSVEPIAKVYAYVENSVLVGVSLSENKSYAYASIDLGVLLPQSDAQKVSFAAPWENAVTDPFSPSEQAATDFLRQPMLVPTALPTTWKKPGQISGELKKFKVYGLPSNQPNTEISKRGVVALDPNTNRIVAFEAPASASLLPAQPLPVEQAKQKAEEFLHIIAAELFVAPNATIVQISPRINDRANYTFRMQHASTGATPTWAEVEVRASDGKIAGYRAQVSAPISSDEGVAEVSILIIDQELRVAPDGKKSALLSNRARDGYPQWWPGRGYGLFVVDAGSNNVSSVAPVASAPIRWSPDSRYFAYNSPSGIQVYDFREKRALEVPQPASSLIDQCLFAWGSSGQLLLGWVHNGPGACDLMGWSPSQPTIAPVTLVKDWSNQVGNDWGAGSFDLSGDSQTLYFTWLLPNDTIREKTHALYSLPANALASTPRKLVELPVGDSVQWSKQGVLVRGSGATFIVDPANAQVREQ